MPIAHEQKKVIKKKNNNRRLSFRLHTEIAPLSLLGALPDPPLAVDHTTSIYYARDCIRKLTKRYIVPK